MDPKKWLVKLFATSFIVIGLPVFGIMGFNYYIDPLWNYTHANDFNDYQLGFDERQLKTNYINSHDFNYDSLLIGTSRITYLDERAFTTESVYNYSLSGLQIEEYLPYMKYAEKKNGKPFKKIFIELYFDSANTSKPNTLNPPQTYIETSEAPFYGIKSLFSESTMHYARFNYDISKANHYDGARSYMRNNIAQTTYPNDDMEQSWQEFKENFKAESAKPFMYDHDYLKRLQAIKDAFPNTELVVFTELMPAKRLQTILHNDNRYEAYSRWMNEMVDVFGTVYSFHTVNEVTTNMDNFFDWLHYYPNVGYLIIKSLENREDQSTIMQDVNKGNLDEYLENVVVDINIE
ncbi:hypothetical protein [Lysinibacillus sp. RS5]|uniref:hypothetical protein n=1 Tax=unclassified Lysinibacillus TaxID=2636778 RepID=UPI0035BE4BAB